MHAIYLPNPDLFNINLFLHPQYSCHKLNLLAIENKSSKTLSGQTTLIGLWFLSVQFTVIGPISLQIYYFSGRGCFHGIASNCVGKTISTPLFLVSMSKIFTAISFFKF